MGNEWKNTEWQKRLKNKPVRYWIRDEIEEIIKEEEVKDEDKAALKYKKNGEYHYGSDPNTYVRVNVIHVPVSSSSRSSSSRSSGSSRPRGGGGGGSHGF